jgi:DNA polymerase III delta prime subunit
VLNRIKQMDKDSQLIRAAHAKLEKIARENKMLAMNAVLPEMEVWNDLQKMWNCFCSQRGE